MRDTVLVVESDVEVSHFVTHCLGDHYDVALASSGRDGLERALALRPALIVSDIMMSVVHEADLFAELRKRRELDDTPIIMLSAKADEELRVTLLEFGIHDFVTRPFSERELLVRVRNLIGFRRVQERERTEAAVNEALYRVAASFANELDQERLLQLITDEATALTGATFGAFFFNAISSDGGTYLLYTLSGAPAEAFSRFPMPRATPLFGPTFRGEGVIRIDDVHDDPTTAVLDIGLPVMDGYELVAALRLRWHGARVRYIAVTGYGQERDKEKAKAAGFDVHLVKPIKLAELAAVVDAGATRARSH